MTTDMTEDNAEKNIAPLKPGDLVKRHRLSTRIWHWLNFATLIIMLMSGLMIFNAHPRLYWGQYGANNDPAWLEIGASAGGKDGAKNGSGYLQIGNVRVKTAGVLGSYEDSDGEQQAHAFPYWATIPSDYNLSFARLWHFAFAWVLSLALLFYILRSVLNGHVKRDLHIRRAQWLPRHIWQDIKDHARLRFPTGAAALEYKILQKLSYIGVIFILLPLMIFTGLTMSPAMDAAWPWLLDLFGGRQSARSLHFIAAFALIAFFVVHILMVLLAGPFNEIRSMITGNFRLPVGRGKNSVDQEEVQ
jgi:thiosulfate reductase cytochrome b subunit